ncbi:protein of unknown function [Micropruina glycogenica]|uniref:Uncharacterized protein n=1 Tax=Micropruina glycogenica TaxID=75385 RepID=A0A2N9JGV7_9ACTN|nr:protein of unknown function [Micropruina glycogenica]
MVAQSLRPCGRSVALGGAVDGLVPGTVHPEAVSRTVRRATTVSDVRRMTAPQGGWDTVPSTT